MLQKCIANAKYYLINYSLQLFPRALGACSGPVKKITPGGDHRFTHTGLKFLNADPVWLGRGGNACVFNIQHLEEKFLGQSDIMEEEFFVL